METAPTHILNSMSKNRPRACIQRFVSFKDIKTRGCLHENSSLQKSLDDN